MTSSLPTLGNRQEKNWVELPKQLILVLLMTSSTSMKMANTTWTKVPPNVMKLTLKNLWAIGQFQRAQLQLL